jgi:hypothetical protein
MTVLDLNKILKNLPKGMEIMVELKSDDDETLLYSPIEDLNIVQYDEDKPNFLSISIVKEFK